LDIEEEERELNPSDPVNNIPIPEKDSVKPEKRQKAIKPKTN
jgi:hypothetical protein